MASVKKCKDEVTNNCTREDVESLKRDHAMLVLSFETQLVAFKAAVQTVLSKEQYEALTVGVVEMSGLLFVQLKEVCTNLEKALPHDADRLKEEHAEFYNRMIPNLEELRSYCDLESAYE